jgi:hypothetical protein
MALPQWSALLLSLVLLCIAALKVSGQRGSAAVDGDDDGPSPLPLSALLAPLAQFPLPRSAPPFRCENVGYLREHVPAAFVLDGVCDCCDGSDERVAHGQHPFFPQLQPQQTSAEAAAAAPAKAADDGDGGGGWFGGFFASSDDDAASSSRAGDANAGFSPCANTCSSRASTFLSDLEARISEYSAGVEAKNARLRTQLPSKLRVLNSAALASQGRVESARAEFHEARVSHERAGGSQHGGGTQATMERIRRAEYFGQRAQQELEHFAWLLGKPVPLHGQPPLKDGSRAMRPPAPVGPYKEWLLLWDTCLEYAWPQRRFGAFGEQRDWYLMTLCPLANATQTAMKKPPAREGHDWREGTPVAAPVAPPPLHSSAPVATTEEVASAAISNEKAADDDTTEEEEEEEEEQSWVLGWWQGVLEQKKEREPADSAEFDNTDAAATEEEEETTAVAPAANGKQKKKKKAAKMKLKTMAAASAPSPSSAEPAGSVVASSPSEPRFSLPLRQGESCWQVGPRQVSVEARCASVDRITHVKEDGKCKYTFGLDTPAACDQSYLQVLKQQLKEHKAWFARRPPPTTPPPSREQLLHEDL